MNKFARTVCVSLIIALLLVTPVYAEASGTFSSIFFTSYDSTIYIPSGSTIEIWFDVVGQGAMSEIGVSSIELEYSSDQVHWFPAKTFLPEDYPQMICRNTGIAYDCVSYSGMYDFCYRAYVTFYAKNNRGIGVEHAYSETIYIPMP